MRAGITALGGEIRFQSRVQDILIDNRQVRGVLLADGQHIACNHLVLAVGHSARDTFQMLYDRGVHIEAKHFPLAFVSNIPNHSLIVAALVSRRAIPFWGQPITNWSTTAATAARCTASACVPVAPWWRNFEAGCVVTNA